MSTESRIVYPLARRSYEQYCTMARALDVVGERWTLLIVRELMLGPRRFTDLLDNLAGIGRNLLTARLRRMEGVGQGPAGPAAPGPNLSPRVGDVPAGLHGGQGRRARPARDLRVPGR